MTPLDFIKDFEQLENAVRAYLEAVEGNASGIELAWLRGKVRGRLDVLADKWPMVERLRLSVATNGEVRQ